MSAFAHVTIHGSWRRDLTIPHTEMETILATAQIRGGVSRADTIERHRSEFRSQVEATPGSFACLCQAQLIHLVIQVDGFEESKLLVLQETEQSLIPRLFAMLPTRPEGIAFYGYDIDQTIYNLRFEAARLNYADDPQYYKYLGATVTRYDTETLLGKGNGAVSAQAALSRLLATTHPCPAIMQSKSLEDYARETILAHRQFGILPKLMSSFTAVAATPVAAAVAPTAKTSPSKPAATVKAPTVKPPARKKSND